METTLNSDRLFWLSVICLYSFVFSLMAYHNGHKVGYLEGRESVYQELAHDEALPPYTKEAHHG